MQVNFDIRFDKVNFMYDDTSESILQPSPKSEYNPCSYSSYAQTFLGTMWIVNSGFKIQKLGLNFPLRSSCLNDGYKRVKGS